MTYHAPPVKPPYSTYHTILHLPHHTPPATLYSTYHTILHLPHHTPRATPYSTCHHTILHLPNHTLSCHNLSGVHLVTNSLRDAHVSLFQRPVGRSPTIALHNIIILMLLHSSKVFMKF